MSNSPQTYHHGDLRSAALLVAGDLLQQGGVDTVVMRAIAGKIGVTHRALYRWFPDRDALLIDLAASGFNRLADALNQPKIGEREGTPTSHFTAAYLHFALNNRHLYKLSMSQSRKVLAHHPGLKASTNKVIDACQYVLGNQLGAQRDDIIALWALLHGLFDLYTNGLIAARDEESFIAYAVTLADAALVATRVSVQPS